MPNPSLSSFTNSNQYQTETALNPLIAGILAGSTFNQPDFSGQNGAAEKDPGGLFGWLVYSRATKYSPARGTTADTYIAYTNPNDLVSDLNQLGGITYCLVSDTTQGGTFGIFKNGGAGYIIGLTAGTDFLYAVNYLAYGGILVVAGTTGGLNKYETDNNTTLDVFFGSTASSGAVNWLLNKPYTTAIFPSVADSTGTVGSGYNMAPYATLSPGAPVSAGSTFANRMFNVCGLKTVTDLGTDSVAANTKITYTISAVSDVAGAFNRTKDRNELYLSVAGLSRSTVLNGSISNSIKWDDITTKNTLRTNRVNFFVTYTPPFLGQDLVGATAGTSTTISVDERIGPARLKMAVTNDVTNITLKYLYLVNNATTRSNLSSEISVYLEKYSAYLDTTQTQIICDSTNNIDNAQALNVTVILKPILSTESISVTVNLVA